MLTGVGYTFSIDPDDSTTYVECDVISVGESMNETVDTFYRLSQAGFPDNVVTSLDPEFALVFKFDEENTLIKSIAEKRLKLGSDRNVGYQIIDNATGNTITGSGVLTSIGTTRTVQAVIEIPVSMKLRGKPTIAVTA